MIRFVFTVLILFGLVSAYTQTITTTTEIPTTSSPGIELTSFAFQQFSNVFAGDVDNVYVGDAKGNVHVSEFGVWKMLDILESDFAITSVEASSLEDQPYFGTSDGIYSYNFMPGATYNNPSNGNRHDLLTGLAIQTADIVDIEEWTEGIWVSTKSNGLLNFGEEGTDVSFTMSNSPLTTNSVASIGLTKTNHVVIAHGNSVSLFRYKQGNILPWEDHNLANLFCDGILAQYVYVGASDEIYVTTNMGVFNYDGTQFNKIPEFGNRDYAKVISTPDGEVWAFEENVGFHILKGGSVGFIATDNVNVPGTIKDLKYDKGLVKFLSNMNNGITSATYVSGTSDADGDGISYTLDGDDGDNTILAAAVEICDDGIDNDCDGEIDEECSTTPVDPSFLVIGQPHPTLGGHIFYLNGLGGGLIVNEEDLLNDQFDSLSMFRWAEPEHLRTETGLEYINFSDWSITSTHSDQLIIDAYGSNGSYAALAIREQLGTDWRLPTATEAYYIDLNLNKADLGDFTDGHYWTSSEVSFNEADIAPPNVVAIDMTNGTLTTDMAKVQALKVRAVRSF